MNLPSRRWTVATLLSLALILPMSAQELSLLGGAMSTRDARLSTYTWQIDYQQNLTRYLAGSIAYINEGHVDGHHRDGDAFEAWARLPLFHDQIALSAGVGAYYFFDTQPLSGTNTADVHGTATIYSLSATAYLSGRWFVKGTVNRILARNDISTNTSAIGLGFWFGQERKPTKGKLGDTPEEYSHVTENELTVFGGQSIVNTLFSEHAAAGAVEYRRGVIPHVDWTVSGIYEGDPKIVRRDGAATQGWLVNTFFDERMCVGIGLGPYFYIDRRHPVAPHNRLSPAAAAPLVSLTAATRISDDWLVRVMFDRVATNYNRDADIILLGLGYRWGERK
jgi:hypothetical protein